MTKEAFCDELDRLITAGIAVLGQDRIAPLAETLSMRAYEAGHTTRELAIASALNLRAAIAAAEMTAADVDVGEAAKA